MIAKRSRARKRHVLNGKILASLLLLLLAFLASIRISVAPSSDPLVSIIEAQTGSSSIILGNVTEPVPEEGYRFTVNVTLEGIQNLWDYEVTVKYNRTLLNCTAAVVDQTDANYVFYSLGDNSFVIPSTFGDDYVSLGASALWVGSTVNVTQGLLCQLNFTAIKTGISQIEFILMQTQSQMFYTFLEQMFPPDLQPLNAPFSAQNFTVTAEAGSSAPVASFTFSPSNPAPNENMTFDASSSYDPDGTIVAYAWDFGDGTNATSIDSFITHGFDTTGNYQINLTVYDNDGLHDSFVSSVIISIIPEFPDAGFFLIFLIASILIAIFTRRNARMRNKL